MRDIPVFTTQYGAAGLVLREIPYNQAAYITIHSSLEPVSLLKECVSFCKMAGAEQIYATGHEVLVNYPFHTSVLQMSRSRKGLPDVDVRLLSVTEDTLEQWRCIYNERMRYVPNGAFMTKSDAKAYMHEGTAWFAYREDTLLGIGIAAEDTIKSVIAVVPGAGEFVLCALCGTLKGDCIKLEVASTNMPAMGLYTRLGFEIDAELSKWYDLTNIFS